MIKKDNCILWIYPLRTVHLRTRQHLTKKERKSRQGENVCLSEKKCSMPNKNGVEF